ncbi:MAG: hypothetical protein WBG90_20780 [Saonia sp.]
MDNYTNLYLIGGSINGLGQLLLLAACIVLIIKQRTLGAGLMLIGSILWPAISAHKDAATLLRTNSILSVLRGIPYLVFASGLLLFAMRILRFKKQKPEDSV